MATEYFNELIDTVNRTCTSLTNSKITVVGHFAFGSCNKLASVSLPNITTVGDNSFYYCTRLTTISLPKVTNIGSRTFYYCTQLKSISLPEVINLGAGTFSGCKNLTEIHFSLKNKEVIEKLNDYNSKFGATNATIYFDL